MKQDSTYKIVAQTTHRAAMKLLAWNAQWLARASIIAIPALLVLFILLALFSWQSARGKEGAERLEFSAISETSGESHLSLEAVRETLRKAEKITSFGTNLSEDPIWFYFTLPQLDSTSTEEQIIYFPSRHARHLQCWYGENLTPLGTASRAGSTGNLIIAKAGFATANLSLSGETILCKAKFVGPARLTVTTWSEENFDPSLRSFYMDMGLLEGGLTVLAAFMLLVAILTREPVYVAFAAWLIVNARLGANSAGWDTLWLGQQVPEGMLDGLRKFLLASNFPLTVFLFTRLLREELKKVANHGLVRVIELLFVPMFAAAAFLPYREFIPVMWSATALGYVVVVFLLFRILTVTKSRAALWFASSLAVTAVAGFSEVFKAAFNFSALQPYINSVTAAICSALFVAIALAEQMRKERIGREEAEVALRKTYDQVPVAFFSADSDGTILRGNPALGHLLGERILRGETRWHELFEEGSWEAIHSALSDHSRAQNRFRSKNGETWYEVRTSATEGLIEGSIEDITAAVSANHKLTYLADHDQLTGTLRRNAITRLIKEAINSPAPHPPVALVYMDLDRFKMVNDLYGHSVGDEVLKQFSHSVSSFIGEDNPLGRVGGDEFLILLHNTTLSEATEKCRTFVTILEQRTFSVQDLAFRIEASFGVVQVVSDINVEDLVSAADRACREAKTDARRVIAYGAEASAFHEQEEERRLVALLTPEKVPGFISMSMQPIMSMRDPYGSLDFEVLLKAKNKDGTLIPTSRVISVAESHGRVGVIDRWMIRSLLQWIETNRDSMPTTRFITVNLSGSSLNDERCMADIYAMLRDHRQAASKLCIEITEGVALRDFTQTRRMIDKLREFDAKLALDDFGAGYTSFSYLSDLSADVLKIDGTLIASAVRHPSRMSIVQAIADLSRNLGMRSIAEWVEDATTVEAMAGIGIDYIQGFGIAKAKQPDEILRAPHSAFWIADSHVKMAVSKLNPPYLFYEAEEGRHLLPRTATRH